MNFIKKIFEGNNDEFVHLQFQKFSRGEFRDKAVMKIKKVKDKYNIYTTAEFANELVRLCAEKLGEGKTRITGAIVSTSDLKNDIEFKEIKQFQGVKRYLVDYEMSGKEIIDLMDRFPKVFFALSFSVDDTNLKIKPKAPKSGKPSTKGEERPKPDFCKMTTKDEKIAKDFIFEKPEFKEAELSHSYFIKEIVIPDELRESNDFLRIREESQRKGTLLREGKIDGEEIKKEVEFCA